VSPIEHPSFDSHDVPRDSHLVGYFFLQAAAPFFLYSALQCKTIIPWSLSEQYPLPSTISITLVGPIAREVIHPTTITDDSKKGGLGVVHLTGCAIKAANVDRHQILGTYGLCSDLCLWFPHLTSSCPAWLSSISCEICHRFPRLVSLRALGSLSFSFWLI